MSNMSNDFIQRILVVDDEERIRKLLRIYLEKEDFVIEEASDGKTALEKALHTDYSLILLDVMIPVIDGIEVCLKLRETKKTPILMLSDKAKEENLIRGFEVGADDYVVKPFSPRELVYRIKALLRRASNHIHLILNPSSPQKKYVLPQFTIDTETCRVLSNGMEICLTPKEYHLLLHLVKKPDKAFSREELLRAVWKYEYIGDVRTVDTHIRRLRDKLNYVSNNAGNIIRTIWGFGYKLVETNLG